MAVDLQNAQSTLGSFKIHEKSGIGEPYSIENGGLYPKFTRSEHKDGDDSGASSSNSDNNVDSAVSTGSDSSSDNNVDSGVSTGSDSSSDSKDSSDSTTPLLDNGHTQEPPTDLPIFPEDTYPLNGVIVDGRGPTTPNKVPIHVEVQNGAAKVYMHESEEVGLNEDHCEKPSLKNDSFWKKIVIIFSTLDILLFITILVVSCGIPTRSPASVSRGDNCLECKDVYLTEDDRHDNIYNFHMDDGGNLCCSENQTFLIQKYFLKRYKQDLAVASAARYKEMPKRTAVHVDLDIQDKNSTSEGVNQVLKWREKDALMNGLTLIPTGRRIQCTRAGLYYINSKVVFKDTEASAATKHHVLLLQVYRSREGQDMLLLENKSSRCGDADRDCNVPSSVQGVFQLQEGDQVFVSVTKPCGLVLEDRYNYLEMYLV
ncbi:uncharacterized protein LOC124253775 isoform X2 [Haliotis rubra]|uniref:uncharacterized protein LOC124253775 isoform X2 n=1 Tax=Haliotis rubra TaxID=36100 RepID=UPI001EE4FE45|nr:uncharacterized protein LOC124253775 isoform X2 [Haliotis rubra]